jgi:hypothetical protein
MPRPGCPPVGFLPARRAAATHLPLTGWHGCQFSLLRRHRMRNGAGKSTTMRVIAGLDGPTSGMVRVNGKHFPKAAAPMAELGILLDARSVRPGLPARSRAAERAVSRWAWGSAWAWPRRWNGPASPVTCTTAWRTTSPSSWRFPTVPWPRSPDRPPRHRRQSGGFQHRREALAETRRLLGVLRADSGLELRHPLPGLSDLESLFNRVRGDGAAGPVRTQRPARGHPARRPAGHLPA